MLVECDINLYALADYGRGNEDGAEDEPYTGWLTIERHNAEGITLFLHKLVILKNSDDAKLSARFT